MFTKIYNSPLDFIVAPTADTTIDDYTAKGIYFFNYARRPSGLPTGANGNGWCIVLNDGSQNYVKQIWISMGSNKNSDNIKPVYMRGLFGDNGWSEWVSIDISNIERGGGGNACSAISLSVKGGGVDDEHNKPQWYTGYTGNTGRVDIQRFTSIYSYRYDNDISNTYKCSAVSGYAYKGQICNRCLQIFCRVVCSLSHSLCDERKNVSHKSAGLYSHIRLGGSISLLLKGVAA